MPLINGQKMACEPCIRGHRSTKCTHANERLMVPVRKPGRPLSSCPHPSSRACSCAAVTAAIPRKQKCRCGTAQPDAVAVAAAAAAETGPAAASPPSPSKMPAGSSFRVQKQASKAVPASRKQSVDLAGLGRMDAGQLNILPAYHASVPAAAPMPPMADMSLYGLGLAPVESAFGPESSMYPIFPYSMQSPVVAPGSAKPVPGQQAKQSDAEPTSSSGGCCGGGAAANGARARPASRHMSSPSPTVNGAADAKPKASCCSGTPDAQEHRPPAEPLPGPAIGQPPNVAMMAPYQTPMAVSNGLYPYFSQPTTFNYPPQFGSFLQPLQPEQWRQFMATMNFAHPSAPSAFGMGGPGPYRASNAPSLPGTPGGTPWTSHQCSCGDTCQCIGCAAHPYNEATQNYVRSAWNTVVDDGHKKAVDANGTAEHVNDHANGHVNGHTNGHVNGHTNGLSDGCHEQHAASEPTTAAKGYAEGTVSPPAPQTPSDGTSGVSEEQTLSANDFFFVSYPFGDSCAGDTTSCPCGDDCQCIGCVIHGNPGLGETSGNSTPI